MAKLEELTLRVNFDISRIKKVLSVVEATVRLQARLKARGICRDIVGSVCSDIADDLTEIIDNFDYEQMKKELEEMLDKNNKISEKQKEEDLNHYWGNHSQ